MTAVELVSEYREQVIDLGATAHPGVLPEPSQRLAETRSRTAEFQLLEDPPGDVDTPSGDLISANLTAAEYVLAAGVNVAAFDPPTSGNWADDTGVVWYLDGDGNGVADGALVLVSVDGQLIGGLAGASDLHCGSGLTYNDPSTAFYSVGIPPDCFADAQRIGWYAEMVYTDAASATTTIDDAPDLTWSEAVNGAALQTPSACPSYAFPHPLPFGEYVSFAPQRMLETRSDGGTVDCRQLGLGRRGAGSVTTLPLAGRAGIPDDAAAVEVNVTVTNTVGPGFVTMFPCGQPRPMASNLNYVTGATVANSAVVALGAGGAVCIFTYAATDVVVDVSGYFVDDSSLSSGSPVRLLDTRSGSPTIDGQGAGIGIRTAGSITRVQVAGRAGVPTGVWTALLNVTVTEAASPGYITAFPCYQTPPTSSNVNHRAGDTVAGAVLARLGADGSFCLYSYGVTHLVVDLQGWFAGDTSVWSLTPARLFDTRPDSPTIDGVGRGAGIRQAGTVTVMPVSGRGGVVTDATAAVLNVTAVDATSPGYLTVYPCDRPRPNASNVNYGVGSVVANQVITALGEDGSVCVFSYGTTHVVVDVDGYIE